MTLATNIRTARHHKGITQQQLADMAWVDARYIRKLESGKYVPDFALLRIARVLGVTVEGLTK